MMRTLAFPALAAGLLALAGCASGTTGDAGDIGDRTKYPQEGHGVTVGSILAPLTFVNPDGSTFSLDADVRADEHHRVLLLTTTAGWCASCKEEQGKLRALYRDLSDHGFLIVSAMFEDDNYGPATPEQAGDWKSRYELPYPVVADPPFVLSAYYDESRTPMMMVVDVDTMEILLLTTGYDETAIRSVVEANLDM